MDHDFTKPTLVKMANAIRDGEKISAETVKPFLDYKIPEISRAGRMMLRVAAAISLFFASVLVIFPEVGQRMIELLPGYFLLPERVARALDYVWGLVGKPVGKQHLMYHLPNIIIYAFGVAGVRQLWRKIHRGNWKDLVQDSQEKLRKMIEEGTGRFTFPPGFSLLFVGESDQTARSLVIDDPTVGATFSPRRQPYTSFWGKFDVGEGEEGFARVLEQFNAEDAGEFVLFPIRDQHLFLPGPHEFDIAPHRVDIAVRRIREFEEENGWDKKRIIIIGDKEQKSRFLTASVNGRISTQNDEICLRSIARNHQDIIVLDPTEATLAKILEIAGGRQILFRASDQGVEKYSAEFYRRLALLGYAPNKSQSLTIGYDISDLETEHQVVCQKESAYLPVILSRDVFDGLVTNHLREDAYIFVPRLVKRELQRLVAPR